MFGYYGKALPKSCFTFVSRAAHDLDIKQKLELERHIYAVRRTRQLSKHDMIRNSATPRIDVNPENFEVRIDGIPAKIAPAQTFPLGQLYWFS